MPQAHTRGAPGPPKPDGSRITIVSTPTHLSIQVPAYSFRRALPEYESALTAAALPLFVGWMLGALLVATFGDVFSSPVGIAFGIIFAVPFVACAVLWAGTILRKALKREKLEVEAQGGRYKLTKELRGLKGWTGDWLVNNFGGEGSSHEGPASELRSIHMQTAYLESRETVGPATASLHWTAGSKLVAFAASEYDGVDLLAEREWVAWEVLGWLEQHQPAEDDADGTAQDCSHAAITMPMPQAHAKSAPRLPKPEASRITIASTPKHLSIQVPAYSFSQGRTELITMATFAAVCLVGTLTMACLALAVPWRDASRSADRIWWGLGSVWLLGYALQGAGIVLCTALQWERLEVEAQGGRYRLTRGLRGMEGVVGKWIVHFYGEDGNHGRKGRPCEGEASQLWGVAVARAYSKETGAVTRASVHWRDGGEAVVFAQSAPEAVNPQEEREWVVGEVLAWLQQHDLEGEVA